MLGTLFKALLGDCTNAHIRKKKIIYAGLGIRAGPVARVGKGSTPPVTLWNLLTKSSVTAVGTSDGQDQVRVGGS